MRKTLFGLVFVFTTLTALSPVANAADEDVRAQCEVYAVEDNIPAEDKEQYIKDCMGEEPVPAATDDQPVDDQPADDQPADDAPMEATPPVGEK
jgi:hypothetical protein